jgi:hypothetical protein
VIRRLLRAAVAALPLTGPGFADPIEVHSSELGSFNVVPVISRFGSFEWRGGLELKSSAKAFGGFSSLALSSDGARMLAVSDRGYWLEAALTYSDGMLSGVTGAEMAPILDAAGKTVKSKVRNDAEALAAWEPGRIDGRVIVGFEGRTRAGTFDLAAKGFKAPFKNLPLPKEIAQGPGNKEMEAIARLPDGRLLAVSEENLDADGNIRAWIFGGGSFAFSIARHADYAITDAAVLPGGDVLTVERSYAPGELPGLAIRRVRATDIAAGARVTPEVLMDVGAPFHAIDNMEGIAVSKMAGETRVTLISDDNYSRAQRTLLLQFALVQ